MMRLFNVRMMMMAAMMMGEKLRMVVGNEGKTYHSSQRRGV